MPKRFCILAVFIIFLLSLSFSSFADKSGTCKNPNGGNYCNSESQLSQCYCDEACTKYGDCCTDYKLVCDKCVAEGKTCGGIQGIQCCLGFHCEIPKDNVISDATGACIKDKAECKSDSDCPPLACIAAPCPKISCVDGKCVTVDQNICDKNLCKKYICCDNSKDVCPAGFPSQCSSCSKNICSSCGNGICEDGEDDSIGCKPCTTGDCPKIACFPGSCPKDCKAECKSDSDCPPIACIAAPCPKISCVDGKCQIPTKCGNGICEDGEADDCPACTKSIPPCAIACKAGNCPQDCKAKTTCEHSDNGINYFVKGTVTACPLVGKGPCTATTDSCINNNLIEYYCSNDQILKISYYCNNGCVDGACIQYQNQITKQDVINWINSNCIVSQTSSGKVTGNIVKKIVKKAIY